MSDLHTEFCGVRFPTPLVLVSGIITSPPALIAVAQEKGVGAVTSKSISIHPRQGHEPPLVIIFASGVMNSVGLKNPGIKQAVLDMKHIKSHIHIPLIASIFAFQMSELPILAAEMAQARPDFIEVNLSCPNIDDEIGKPFASDPLLSALAIQEVKRVVKKIPVIAKLTPNVIDIKEIARAVEEAGADAISAVNTAGPGLLIDLKTCKPKLGHGVGGISGAAIKPLALRCVYDIAKSVKIPIIGMGGIRSGEDALEMIAVGATLVGVGSAVYGVGNSVFGKIYEELEAAMQKYQVTNLVEVRGKVRIH